MIRLTNQYRITASEAVKREGYESIDDFLLSDAAQDSIIPACCDEGCQVEPDGRCEHGCPSVLIVLGMI